MILTIDKEILKKIYPKREVGKYYKKYTFGLLLVIGGGEFYSGSPAFNALSAFRAGVDMVRIFAPKRAADIIASFSPNLAAFPLEGENLFGEHLAFLISQVESAKDVSNRKCALVVGGGLGRTQETLQTIEQLLEKIDIPLVIDADALYALSQKPDVISGKKAILTPHVFEFFILTGKKIENLNDQEKANLVKQEAKKLKATILLKGKPDIISDGENIAFNNIGSPYMSVGGTGDVLAGICGAFLARNIDPFLSACGAAFLNGLAGKIAGEKLGEGLTALDVLEAIPQALKEAGIF